MRSIIRTDFFKFSHCIPMSVLLSVFIISSYCIYTERADWKKKLTIFLFNFSLISIACITLLRFPSGVDILERIDLKLIGTWNEGLRGQMFVIENFILFLPLGFFGRALFGKTWKITLFCFLMSVSIELTQMIFGLGFTELSDVIQNTFGGMTGAMIWLAWRHLRKIVANTWEEERRLIESENEILEEIHPDAGADGGSIRCTPCFVRKKQQ